MTLHLSFPSMYKSRYKKFLLKIKLWASLTEAWSPRVILSLSFFSLIANAIILRVSLDPAGAGPRQLRFAEHLSHARRCVKSVHVCTLV